MPRRVLRLMPAMPRLDSLAMTTAFSMARLPTKKSMPSMPRPACIFGFERPATRSAARAGTILRPGFLEIVESFIFDYK